MALFNILAFKPTIYHYDLEKIRERVGADVTLVAFPENYTDIVMCKFFEAAYPSLFKKNSGYRDEAGVYHYFPKHLEREFASSSERLFPANHVAFRNAHIISSDKLGDFTRLRNINEVLADIDEVLDKDAYTIIDMSGGICVNADGICLCGFNEGNVNEESGKSYFYSLIVEYMTKHYDCQMFSFQEEVPHCSKLSDFCSYIDGAHEKRLIDYMEYIKEKGKM